MPEHFIAGSVEAVCRNCQTTNHITAVHVSATEAVKCSRCGVLLGDWDALTPAPEDVGGDGPTTAAPR